ncbi:MAG: phage major capsid protein [Roseburia faecis]|nr:phage major capsid protein [Roseburia faecis]
MSKEMRELLNKINAKKAEIKALVADGKIEDATSAKEELKDLQKSFDILADLDDDDAQNAQQQAQQGTAQTAAGEKNGLAKQVKAFTNAIKAAWKKTDISPEDKEILNAMSEGSDEDGGLTVPKDIKTKIKELRRSEDALETLVNVEHVTTNSGSRVIEREADQTPFDNVDEAAEFPDVSTPQFENVDYKIKKKGGILKVTQELLSDTAENIMNYLKKWIAKKAKATRNFMIIAKIKEICKGLEVTVTGLDNLKDIFNVMLDPAIALGAVVVTNQSGFNFLDKLKDEKGNYILQKDPTQATKKLLFGEHPVIKLSNKTLQNIDGKAPIICGDLKEAITIFDRETLTIDISNLAAGMWERDQTGIKVRERLDIQTVDADAVVMGLATVSTTGTDLNGDGVPDDINGDGKYNEKELNKLTKAEILELAKTKSYTMTKTEQDTKADIIAEFLTQQAG